MITEMEWARLEDMIRRVHREELTRYQARIAPVPRPILQRRESDDNPPPLPLPVPSPPPPDTGSPGRFVGPQA